MGPGAAIATSLKRSLDFTGRSTRSEFWWTWGMLYPAALLILSWRALPFHGAVASGVATALLCGIALTMMAVGTRRLADAGVWRWLFVLVFLFGVFAQIIYRIPVPSEEALSNLTVQLDDASVPASDLGYYPYLRMLREIMPWIGQPLAILCLLLALLPSRQLIIDPESPEVTT